MPVKSGQFILGFTCSGKRFRPSDWSERIASSFASFDAGHRLQYHPCITPMKMEGQTCLFVADSLAETDPEAFEYIMSFVNSNQLQIIKKPETRDGTASSDVQTAA